MVLLNDNGQESVAWLMFVRTSADLALALGENLRSQFASSGNDIRVINAPVTESVHLVALFSSPEYPTVLWEEEALDSIVSWFEMRDIEWGSDAYELMTVAHFALDYPSEFGVFMHSRANIITC